MAIVHPWPSDCSKDKPVYSSHRLLANAPAQQISFLYFLYYVRSAGGYGTLESIRGGAQDSRIIGGSQLLSLKNGRAAPSPHLVVVSCNEDLQTGRRLC